MSWQRGWGEGDEEPPLEWWVPKPQARIWVLTAFLFGAVVFGVIGFGAGMAFGAGGLSALPSQRSGSPAAGSLSGPAV